MTGLLSVAGSSPSEGFELKSCRFNKSDSAYLYRTNTAGGDRRVATWSFWVKPGEIGATNRYVFSGVGD